MKKAVSDFTYPSEDVIQCPYEFYQSLREDAPVFRVPGTDTFLVSRYETCLAILKNPEDFSSVRPWEKPNHPDALALLKNKGWQQHHLLSGTDPPEHTRLRKVAKQAFTRRRITYLEKRVKQIANALVDDFEKDGHVELNSQFAELLPLLVICEMLGVQEADVPRIRHWSDSVVALSSGDISVEKEVELTQDLVDFQHYLKRQIDAWRAAPKDGFLGDMIGALDDDGKGLDDPNLIDLFRLLLAAGHETTMQFIGNTVFQLIQRPDEIQRLKADFKLIPNFVEESLRTESAVTRINRVATRDLELDGVKIPKGARVLPMIGAANRDMQHFDDPEVFKPEREEAIDHLAFGWGMHMCLGAPLARIEAIVALETLLSRLPNLRLASDKTDPKWRSLVTRRGLGELHLEFDS